MAVAAKEGVTKFAAAHDARPLDGRSYGRLCCKLVAWREIMALTSLVGRDPDRYDGAAYGNVSARVGAPSASRGRRAMLITGTQTGDRKDLSLADFALVTRYELDKNRVESAGETPPSSETMTHGAVYDCSPTIRVVLHAHSPVVWSQAREHRIPTTHPDIEYGTVEMAREVMRLYRDTGLAAGRLFAMGGHEDGIVVFGRDTDEAGATLLKALARAYEDRCALASGSRRS